ncbi:YcxB family protein [Methylobacterium sp. sgz302541]|uniref:YcxB family protein n=1 Tax=unclassified Methylobacterium TaxID=2615210 RepID=UPI003D329B1C
MSTGEAPLPISVIVRLTSDDVVRAYRVHAAAQAKSRQNLIAGAVAVLCIAGFLMVTISGEPAAIVFIVAGSILGGIAFQVGLIRWYVPRVARRIYAQQQDLQGDIAISADAEALSSRAATGDSRTPWSHYLRWREDAHTILLYRSELMFQFIPKRILSVAQIDALRMLAEKKTRP